MFDFLEFLRNFDAAALTLREQTRIDNRDTDELIWDALFPRADVDSIVLSEMRIPDYRPTADRRNWDGDGRLIPLVSGDYKEWEMLPIGTYFTYGERHLTRLLENFQGNADLVLNSLNARIPDRIETNVDADYRRLELDAFNTWTKGEIDVVNPQTGTAQTVSLEIDPTRYPTEDWVSGNAYVAMLDAINDADRALRGGVGGAVLTQEVLYKVRNDAATFLDVPRLTRTQLIDQFGSELGRDFSVRVESRTTEVFTGAGSARTETRYMEPPYVAFVPQSQAIGVSAFAPIGRAYDYVQQTDNRVDVRGVSVFPEAKNNGKQLKVETQLNAMPVPREGWTYVIDTGITG